MTPEETKAYIDDFMTEIWDRGNIDKVDEYFAPNFVSRTPGPFGSDREGRRQMIHMFMDAFSEWKSDESVILGDGDLALVRWAGSAKHTGDFMGVPATGNLVCIGGMSTFRIVDGKIIEAWDYPDMMGLMQQIGAAPAMGEAVAA